MVKLPLTKLPTAKQAQVLRVLSDIVYKGVALFTVLGLLVVGFIALLYVAIKQQKPVESTLLASLDGLFGYLLKQVYASLFKVDGQSAPDTAREASTPDDGA